MNIEHTVVVSDRLDFPAEFLPLAKAQGRALSLKPLATYFFAKLFLFFAKNLSVSVIFLKNDTITKILNFKNYFWYLLRGVS